MNPPDRRDTAKIYRFPQRTRLVPPMPSRSGHAAPAQLYAIAESGAGWYHECAIQDDLRDRKS